MRFRNSPWAGDVEVCYRTSWFYPSQRPVVRKCMLRPNPVKVKRRAANSIRARCDRATVVKSALFRTGRWQDSACLVPMPGVSSFYLSVACGLHSNLTRTTSLVFARLIVNPNGLPKSMLVPGCDLTGIRVTRFKKELICFRNWLFQRF